MEAAKSKPIPYPRTTDWHCRFFISHNKYMGLCPPESQEGDIICVLFGCNEPLVLRKVEDHYVFIGKAYFYGWMYGKATELYREGKLSAQEFVIN